MGWRGILAGALGLAFLELIVSDQQAAGRVGGALSGIGDAARRFLSPGVPAFSKPAPSSSSSSNSSGGGLHLPSFPDPFAPGFGVLPLSTPAPTKPQTPILV